MRKILIVFNGVGYPTHVMDFVMKLSNVETSWLHAVFMKPMHVLDSLQYPFPNDLSNTQEIVDKGAQAKTDVQAIEDNKKVFIDECQIHNIKFKVDDEIEMVLEELVEHSKFSDLIIADVNDDLGKYSIQDLLSKTQCPIILVQRQSEIPGQIVLAYDGSPSSMLAIKMYSYLFPEWRKVKTLLVQVNAKEHEKDRHQRYLEDWLNQHFPNLDISYLEGNVETEMTAILDSQSQKTMMVMGAYGKKGLASFFHQSLANKIVDASHVSLFIAHQ